MKILFEKLTENPASSLRRAGYAFRGRTGDEMEFARVLSSRGTYPRFHIYARVEGTGLSVSLHLDRTRETHGESVRHHGEYGDEGLVGEEARRLLSALGAAGRIVA